MKLFSYLSSYEFSTDIIDVMGFACPLVELVSRSG